MESLFLSSKFWCTQSFVCALQDWSLCSPQSCESLIIKSHWLSKSDSLGIPCPFVRSSVWEAWWVVQNLHTSGKTCLALFFSSLWVTHSESIGFDCIMIAPLLPSCWNFFFVFGFGNLFLVGSSILLPMIVQQLVAIVMLSQEEMNTYPSVLPSWSGSSGLLILFNILYFYEYKSFASLDRFIPSFLFFFNN